MNSRLLLIALGILSMCLFVQLDLSLAAKGGGGGYHGGDGGGNKGDIYSDLWIIMRDENGVPILENGCVQPLLTNGTYLILDGDCELPEAYEELVQEVELGRLNLSRAPSDVLDHAYEEVLKSIAAADEISFDSAGRLIMKIEGEDKTIDSARENLALYRELMVHGYLKDVVLKDQVKFPVDNLLQEGSLDPDKMFHAANFLGGAADKTGHITVDTVVYLNSILGINGKKYSEYFTFPSYTYTRSVERSDDVVTYLVLYDNFMYEWIENVPVLDAVFDKEDYSSVSPASDFARAADDAREIVDFVHLIIH